MEILIKGLITKGCHGVLFSEKTTAQSFEIDMTLTLPDELAAQSDELFDSVDYSAVCALVEKTVERESYNLIERLASRLAKVVLDGFEKVSMVNVTVKKPNPPMMGQFDYMAAHLVVKRCDG